EDEVEAVEQRAGELVAVAREPLRRAAALGGRVTAPAARAQVHRRDEHEAGRKDDASSGPRDRYEAVLQRLAQRLERRTLELGELVEEQHAAVREARLARPEVRPAADDCGGG